MIASFHKRIHDVVADDDDLVFDADVAVAVGDDDDIVVVVDVVLLGLGDWCP